MSSTEVEVVEAVDERRTALVATLSAKLGDALVDTHIRPGDELWLRVTAEAWADTFRMLRDVHGLKFFNFLSAIDWMPSPFGRDMDAQVDAILQGKAAKPAEVAVAGYAGGDTRFQVFARLNNLSERWGLIIKADVPDETLTVPSVTSLFAGAGWHEREVAEMYGIDFAGHPDQRKLYLPTEFEGFPLRKDFPLLARRIKPWPGIVDVEQMPGDDEAEEAAAEG